MQTNISQKFQNTPAIEEAESILRSCVHCGFCTATCPTYQLLGDELDSPRGRIYLIKQLLEGEEVTEKTRTHLDRCLTCRSCETTCPSGVRYHRLVDIGREIVERAVPRPWKERLTRKVLRNVLPYPQRVRSLVMASRVVSPIIPSDLKSKIPVIGSSSVSGVKAQERKMLVLQGCVQSVATPETNIVTGKVLEKLGIELVVAAKAGCCGAVSYHMSAHEEGLSFMRKNIDAWWPQVEQGAEAIIVTASGCGAMVKEYGDLLKHDANYAVKAKKVSELARDISEVLHDEDLSPLNTNNTDKKVAFHSPCTLQHGQQIQGVVEGILTKAGFTLTKVADAHLCCGSAGTYSILQPELSQQLLDNKLSNLQMEKPDVIATANIGCQMHMASKAGVPVKHWIALLGELVN